MWQVLWGVFLVSMGVTACGANLAIYWVFTRHGPLAGIPQLIMAVISVLLVSLGFRRLRESNGR